MKNIVILSADLVCEKNQEEICRVLMSDFPDVWNDIIEIITLSSHIDGRYMSCINILEKARSGAVHVMKPHPVDFKTSLIAVRTNTQMEFDISSGMFNTIFVTVEPSVSNPGVIKV